MLESGLFFTLGFLAAALLALMIAPAIWRRAVVLTRQRIESSVPLTLNEIQADKDQLRAEFAMSTRRLEVSLEQLKERAAEQMIEINRRRDEVLGLEDEHKNKSQRISELQAQSEELRAEMRDREEKLSQLSINVTTTEAKLDEKALELESLDRRYREVINEFDDQKIELVARETKLDGISDEVRELRAEIKAGVDKNTALMDEKKAIEANLKREKDRALDLDKKIARMQTTMSDMEARLDRRDRDLAKTRDKSGQTTDRALKAETVSNKLQSENVKLKSQLADAAQRMEALLNNASDENVVNALALLEGERDELRTQLQSAESEREALKIELSAVQLAGGDDWEIERRENAIVRERINDLAAQVTAMTAAMEGPDSPINEVLKTAGRKAAKGTGARKKTAKEVNSLADRIRALQEAAEKA